MSDSFILNLSCPDRPGIVHAITGLIGAANGNITEAAQYNDRSTGLFFARMRFDCPEGPPTDTQATQDTPAAQLESLRAQFKPLAEAMQMRWGLHSAGDRVPTLIMVSKLGHCLNDLLFRYRTHLLPLQIKAIVSNHRDFYQLAAASDIPFHYIPVTPDTKASAEAKLLDLVKQEGVELVVLARYMQVLSNDACRALAGKAINIHHSFLPSFKGAKPYQQAFDRGVKTIGATAHYVTADLDEGPIIEQGTARADHAMDVAQLTAMGRDVESSVLARAVVWHAERRVLLNGHKTVIFK